MNVAEPHVEIGSLIASTPEIKGGCPRIAGTGVTVKRIAGWHRMGMEPEQIAAQYGHLTLAQVHAALSYYYANRAEIDADLDDESAEYDRRFEQSRGKIHEVGQKPCGPHSGAAAAVFHWRTDALSAAAHRE